eukprot:scaffold96480_cov37-Prasinocladus_malaysianus.AAC.1
MARPMLLTRVAMMFEAGPQAMWQILNGAFGSNIITFEQSAAFLFVVGLFQQTAQSLLCKKMMAFACAPSPPMLL